MRNPTRKAMMIVMLTSVCERGSNKSMCSWRKKNNTKSCEKQNHKKQEIFLGTVHWVSIHKNRPLYKGLFLHTYERMREGIVLVLCM